MSVEQLIIERFVDTLRGDASFKAILPDINRNDGRPKMNQNRRCDLSVISFQPDDVWLSDGSLVKAWTGVLRADVVYKRGDAFGTSDNPEHAGDVDAALDRLDALLENKTLAVTGYGLATLGLGTRGRGEASDSEVRRYSTYRFNLMTGSSRRINGADISVSASGLGDRVVLGFSEQSTGDLLEDTGWNQCGPAFSVGDLTQRVTLLIAQTSEEASEVSVGTTLSDAVITKAGSSRTVNLLVYASRPAPVRAGGLDLHYTELSCVVNPDE